MNKQRGVALLAVMILVALVLSTLATLFYRQGIDLNRTSKMLHGEQAMLLALSGEVWASEMLKRDAQEQEGVDHLQEPWAQQAVQLPVAGGQMSARLEDLQGRININHFGRFSARQVATLLHGAGNSEFQQLRRLASNARQPLSDAQLSALVDWLDDDDQPLPEGAEANTYLLREPAYRPANGDLVSLDELGLIKGFDAVWVRRLRPFLTVLPASAVAVNVNTAGPEVLQSLADPIDAAAAAALIRSRKRAVWESLDDFYLTLAGTLGLGNRDEAAALLKFSGRTPVSVESHYFQLTLTVSLGVEELQLQSLLYRRSSEEVTVIARTLEFVPRLYPTDAAI